MPTTRISSGIQVAPVEDLTSFEIVLETIREQLGSNWVFYKECLSAIIGLGVYKQDTSAWYEQMQRLVEGNDRLKISHEGLIFILREMIESETPPVDRLPSQPRSTTMEPPKISAQGPFRKERPPMYIQMPGSYLPPRTTFQQERTPYSAFFDFGSISAPPRTPSSTAFPQHSTSNVAYFGETRTQEQSSTTGMRDTFNFDGVLFTDPHFKREVDDFFSSTEDKQRSIGSNPSLQQKSKRKVRQHYANYLPPYCPADDDLHIWKKRIEKSQQKPEDLVKGDTERGITISQLQQVRQERLLLDDK